MLCRADCLPAMPLCELYSTVYSTFSHVGGWVGGQRFVRCGVACLRSLPYSLLGMTACCSVALSWCQYCCCWSWVRPKAVQPDSDNNVWQRVCVLRVGLLQDGKHRHVTTKAAEAGACTQQTFQEDRVPVYTAWQSPGYQPFLFTARGAAPLPHFASQEFWSLDRLQIRTVSHTAPTLLSLVFLGL